jgi:hypothetical protein
MRNSAACFSRISWFHFDSEDLSDRTILRDCPRVVGLFVAISSLVIPTNSSPPLVNLFIATMELCWQTCTVRRA